MSASPPKDLDAEVGEHDQSPDEQEQQEHMERNQQDASQQQPVFDFEVKEQDRWLPIANGELPYIYPIASATAIPSPPPACAATIDDPFSGEEILSTQPFFSSYIPVPQQAFCYCLDQPCLSLFLFLFFYTPFYQSVVRSAGFLLGRLYSCAPCCRCCCRCCWLAVTARANRISAFPRIPSSLPRSPAPPLLSPPPPPVAKTSGSDNARTHPRRDREIDGSAIAIRY